MLGRRESRSRPKGGSDRPPHPAGRRNPDVVGMGQGAPKTARRILRHAGNAPRGGGGRRGGDASVRRPPAPCPIRCDRAGLQRVSLSRARLRRTGARFVGGRARAVPDRVAIVRGSKPLFQRALLRRTGVHFGGERSSWDCRGVRLGSIAAPRPIRRARTQAPLPADRLLRRLRLSGLSALPNAQIGS